MKVYLAGGFRTPWREGVKQHAGFVFIDPKDKESGRVWSPQEIGAWDLHAIRQSDVVFAYMERTNPSGFGLACEIGYAYGLGKTVILVLEPNHETHSDRYLAFLTKVAHITFPTPEEGIAFLRSLA